MATGISLHIGLNSVDPSHYNAWEGKLNACENDARDMELIAVSQGFHSTLLLGRNAGREQVRGFIRKTGKQMKKGDIFFISYSGHGGQLPDLNGDEPDGQDETWCLYNGQLVDDELKELWSSFEEGTRILLTSDSCHSGTIVKSAGNSMISYSDFHPRYMSDDHSLGVYLHNKSFYDSILYGIKKTSSYDIRASILQISACQDNQYAYDGAFNGAFTAALKRVWNGGIFNLRKGSYRDFHRQILNLLPAYQSPNLLSMGKNTRAFENQKPFTI